MTDATITCRSCGNTRLTEILSLGQTPLANALLPAAQLHLPEQRYPLDVLFCANCGLVQIGETIPPETLFREYVYFSSFSDTALENARQLAGRLQRQRSLDGSSLVVELGSNDGYLLQYYRDAGVPVLGVEPALNIAQVARERGIDTVADFFTRSLAETLARDGVRADVIHANNVLAHVADLNGTVAGMAAVLKPWGLVVIEVPYLRDLIDNVEFDTIYHEHLCYFSVLALDRLFERHGLRIIDVEHVSIHGGTLRLFAQHRAAERGTSRGHVESLLMAEKDAGMDQEAYYRAFGRRVGALKRELLRLLRQLKNDGNRVAAYGASAKGTTLLSYCGVGRETLDYVVDRSTVKQGLYTPGSHLPIFSPARLLSDRPQYVLLLTWNFAEEILSQQAEFRSTGGKFIVPIPHVSVV